MTHCTSEAAGPSEPPPKKKRKAEIGMCIYVLRPIARFVNHARHPLKMNITLCCIALKECLHCAFFIFNQTI